jgi:hypothetical protein
MGELNVLQQVVIKWWVSELEDGLRDIVSRGFHWDIIVFLEVNTGLLLGRIIHDTKELTLHTWIGWSRDVFSISPLSITTTASNSGATSSWVAVRILVEAALGGSVPTTATRRGSATTGSEVRSVGPVATRARVVTWEAVRSSWATPRAAINTTIHGRGSAVHGLRASTSYLSSHVGRNVRALFGPRAVQVKTVHVELISHAG